MSDTGPRLPASPNSAVSLSFAGIAKAARLPLAIVGLLILFGLVEPRVLSLGNFRNIAVQTSYLAIFAMAQTMVILTRGFDLSLGYTVSLVSVVASIVFVHMGGGDASIPYGIAAGIALAAVVGLANGLLIGGIGINPLVTTLGMANIVMAFASTISNGFPVTGLPGNLTAWFAQGSFLTIPVPIWFAAAIFVVLSFTLRATKFGRYLYIIGANPRAAIAAGVKLRSVLALSYVVCSVLTALGALLLTARTGSGEPTLGGNLTLQAIAAAVVGGVHLSGGEGGVGPAVLGALFITILSNGMNLVQIDGYLQQICLGVIIVASLFVGRDAARR
jgi:ribose transport system permease protein